MGEERGMTAEESSQKQYNQEASSQWQNATAGAVAGFATVAAMHPLDVVRTRFQVNDGRVTGLPTYRNTGHAVLTIARMEGIRGLYAGFSPAVLGSTVAWGLYFFFYSRAKQRYSKGNNQSLSPLLHLASAAEAGGLVSLCTNPIWLVKTRFQLQAHHQSSRPYSGLYDAFKTIMREEGWKALYKGLGPGLILVSHGAIQFTVYEELRKLLLHHRSNGTKGHHDNADSNLLNTVDYAVLGGSSKLSAILLTHPFQVVRARMQVTTFQRPGADGTPRYLDSWHVVKESFRYEGFRAFYKGITPTILKSVPTSSITFLVYENVLKLLKLASRD
ncbi:unnamed protein product [Linum tenue]|uniref:Folate transporter 1, chloroplastic n=1 Tax=Linum tenue TaxID=586396 RepID=A0AAV0I888_9ROSI|nr:unnamed protein product [Linum tenue]